MRNEFEFLKMNFFWDTKLFYFFQPFFCFLFDFISINKIFSKSLYENKLQNNKLITNKQIHDMKLYF